MEEQAKPEDRADFVESIQTETIKLFSSRLSVLELADLLVTLLDKPQIKRLLDIEKKRKILRQGVG